jgi:hypothetical protein
VRWPASPSVYASSCFLRSSSFAAESLVMGASHAAGQMSTSLGRIRKSTDTACPVTVLGYGQFILE